jgi:hypothetical protein
MTWRNVSVAVLVVVVLLALIGVTWSGGRRTVDDALPAQASDTTKAKTSPAPPARSSTFPPPTEKELEASREPEPTSPGAACADAVATLLHLGKSNVLTELVTIPLELASTVISEFPQGGPRALRRDIWWSAERKLQKPRAIANRRVITKVTVEGWGARTLPDGSEDAPPPASLANTIFCPGPLRVHITCMNCRDFAETSSLTQQVAAARRNVSRASDVNAQRVFADGPLPREDDMRLTSRTPPEDQPVFVNLLADLQFGPDGFYVLLDGPERVAAIATWDTPAANPPSEDVFTATVTLGARTYLPAGLYSLSVIHAWSGWQHLEQHAHYGVSHPSSLVSPRSSQLVALNGFDDHMKDTPAWLRFDAVRRETLEGNATVAQVRRALKKRDYGVFAATAPPVVDVFPYASGQHSTHTMRWLAGRYHWSGSDDLAGITFPQPPAPALRCNDSAHIPELMCAVRMRLWRWLHATRARDNEPLFSNRTIAVLGESQVSQLIRQLETLANGDLADDVLVVPSGVSERPRVQSASGNRVDVPYSAWYSPAPIRGSAADASMPSGLRVYSLAPRAKVNGSRVHTSGARVSVTDVSVKCSLNISALPPSAFEADYLVVMLCQFCIIVGAPIEDVEVRFARYLLALHGLGPDASRDVANRAVSSRTVVAVMTCPPMAMVNPYKTKSAADYYRIRFLDHRNAYSVKLWGRAILRVVRFVNRHLAKHSLPAIVSWDHYDVFLPFIDATYDGDHWAGLDAHFAAMELMLHELAAARAKRL